MGADGVPTRVVVPNLGAAVRRSFLSATTIGAHVFAGTTTLLIVLEHRLAIAVAANVTGAESASLLATRLADVFVRLPEAR